jgi:hypothetical protein
VSHLRVLIVATIALATSAKVVVAQSTTDRRLPPCFSADSGRIAFGTISRSPVTDDASGNQYTFQVTDGQLRGWVRRATGETPPAQPLDSIVYKPEVDSLFFSYHSSGGYTRYSYWVRPDCRTLRGKMRLFETPEYAGEVYDATIERAREITKP